MIGKKLLVADDSLTIQKVIRLALSSEGYEIQTVSDGNDAIQQIAVFRPDIVLIDVSLPIKSAFEVKSAVENGKDFGPVRFILMSSAYEKVDEGQIEAARFAGRLTKPFDPAHLRKILNDVLALSSPSPLESQAAPEMPELPEMREMPAFQPDLAEPAFQMPNEISAPQTEMPSQEPEAPHEFSNDLWDKNGEFIMPPPPPAVPPGLSAQEIEIPVEMPTELPETQISLSENDNTDIKHLTESTIRMSGLDDFQWSVNEPSLKPPAGLVDQDNPTFELGSPPSQTAPASQAVPHNDPGFPLPPPPAFEMNLDNLEVDFDIGQPEPPAAQQPARQPIQYPNSRPAPAPNPSTSPSISKEDIEAMVKKHLKTAVEEALMKFAQNSLPEVAERLLKQEIHRLLSEET